MSKNEKRDEKPKTSEEQNENSKPISETWAQDALDDLDEFIESQGIYIRQ